MNIFSIPPTVSFVDALASGIMARYGQDPMQLAAVTVLLPNRRAVRALREAFLRNTGGTPLLLPNIRPIGDVDEDAVLLGAAAPELDMPPAIEQLRRTLILARYLTAAYKEQFTLAQALSMASELGRFLDSVETEGLSLDALDNLVPENYAAHWQISLGFLKDVLRVFWPQQLATEGLMDAGARRRTLIAAYTEKLRRDPPKGPVIAAGSTGSIPVTAELLKTVANLPQGCVVLPGLDTVLEDDFWATALEEGHPQAGLARLLLHMEATRANVIPWLENAAISPREILISSLMRPAPAIKSWSEVPLPQDTLKGVALIEAETLDEEASCIALIMREHAEDASQTEPCVLVTPDRILANRVALQLRRWGIGLDDSAGTPLAHTPIGRWLLLLCDVLANGLEPVSFLALLKQGFARGGQNWPVAAGNFDAFVNALDKDLLRGPRPEEGFAALKNLAIVKPNLQAGLAALENIFAPALETLQDADASLRAILRVAEDLASTPETHGSHVLWSGEAGEAMADAMAALLEQTDVVVADKWADIRAVLDAAMAGVSVRPRFGTHPRLAVLGPIEARLYQTGKMILGSLNEGTWPKLPETDGWLSRDMRRKFGLPAPERAITLSSHDFAQGLGAKTVYLTRSKNRDGAPATKCRWLQRLDTLCTAQPEKPDLQKEAAHWLSIARGMDAPENVTPVSRPAPNPPIAARPKKLSVTEIAKWRRDPYYVYAKHVLGLKPLDAIAAEPDAGDQGDIIHKALHRFAEKYPKDLPEDALEQLRAIGRDVFAQAHSHPDVIGHWWPRFVRMAQAFVPHEKIWRQQTLRVFPEIKGSIDIPTAAGAFTLHGRADRIEHRTDGWAIIDYKSGTAPSNTKVQSGEEPQLTLMAAMLLRGAFNEALKTATAPDAITNLSYWKTNGGADVLVTTDVKDVDKAMEEAWAGIAKLVRAYLEDGMPYTCWPDPANKLRDDYEYAHLARIAEWTNADDLDDWEDAA